MLKIIYALEDAELATRLQQDLTAQDSDSILVVVLSPTALVDTHVTTAIEMALDSGQQIVPVIARPVVLPKLIDHLSAVDFTQSYDLAGLKAQLQRLSGPNAPRPLKARTASVRAANRRVGYWLGALVLVWFVIGVVGVMSGIKMPKEEYQVLDTQTALEVITIIARNLPHTTAEAQSFPLTLQAAPTRQRPFLITTTTAMAAVPQPEATATPMPES